MGIIELLFPKSCLGCGKSGRYVCEECIRKVRKPIPFCPECLLPSSYGVTHAACNKEDGLDGLVSIWKYERVLRRAILSLKYKFAFEIAKELSTYTVEIIQRFEFFPKDTILVPTPLYWLRKNWRGFNQTEEIGRVVANKMGWRYMPNLLKRRESRIPQAGLGRQERLKNVQGIFSVNPGYKPEAATYILFDDVWTTGSTLKEAARQLKKAGTRKILGFTLAK
jgi:ComF family protein